MVRMVAAIQPACLIKEKAAEYCGLSVSMLEKLVRERTFPAPRQLSARRVGYLVRELNEWLETRPAAQLPPPAADRTT